MEPITADEPKPVVDAPVVHKPARTPWMKRKAMPFVAVAVIIVAVVAMSMHVYAKPTDEWSRKIVGVIPYPAVVVNGSMVGMSDFLIERDALMNYFTVTGTQDSLLADEELDAKIVDTLVNKTLIAQIANEHDIALDAQQTEEFYAKVVDESGGEEAFQKQLSETFGWSTQEFQERVVNSVVLAGQVNEWVAADAELQRDAKSQADAAFARLEAGEEFAIVAGEVSQDSSAMAGGDIGFLNSSEMAPEWGDAVRALAVGSYSSVIETVDSFLIFKLTDRIEAEDDAQLQLSVIVVPKETLNDYVKERVESSKIWRFVGKI